MSVTSIIRQLCVPCRETVHLRRADAVEAVSEAIALGGSMSPSQVGRNLRSTAMPKHCIKRVDRLLSNRRMHEEWSTYYAAIAEFVLRDVRRPIIAIDWSGTVKGLHTLAAAVPIGGRAITIYAEVHPESKYLDRGVQNAFLDTLSGIIGINRRPILIADAGFSVPFMEKVEELGWDFVIRVRGGVYLRELSSTKWLKCHDLYATTRRKPRDLGQHLFTRSRRHQVRLVLSKKPKRKDPKRPLRAPVSGMKPGSGPVQAAREPWLLVTSLADEPARIVELYSLRMQIEETFRDCKSHRFGWSLRHVNSKSHKRMTTLLLLAAIAMVAVIMIGIATERLREHKRYQANTLTRRVLSHFYLGCCVVMRGDLIVTARQAMQASREVFRRAAIAS